MKQKARAGRNRTLFLEDSEIPALEKRLVTLERLKAGAQFLDATINADSAEAMKFLPDGFADLVLLDPPYNLSKNFNGTPFSRMKDSDYEDYLDSWLPAVCAKLKDGGSLYMCGDWKCTAAMQRALEKRLRVLNRITWQREKGRGASANWKNGMEDIWFAVKDPDSYYFDVEAVKVKRRVLAPYREGGAAKGWSDEGGQKFRLTFPSNFWDDISVPFWSMPENTEHPAQKPEKLFAKLILASSRKGDVVFDPFLGSGTASVVAKKLGRRFCGIEAQREYCLLAEKRLLLAEKNPSIQGYADGVFWERNTANLVQKAKNSSDNEMES